MKIDFPRNGDWKIVKKSRGGGISENRKHSPGMIPPPGMVITPVQVLYSNYSNI